MQRRRLSPPVQGTLLSVLAAAALSSCSSGSSTKAASTPTASTPASTSAGASTTSPSTPPGLAAVPGYHVAVFAKAAGAYANPDSIAVDGNAVFVGFQNVTAKDGTDGKSSTVVQYDLTGKVIKTFDVPGHNDGLRVDPATHLLWAMSNEDGHPQLTTLDPSTGTKKAYTIGKTAHGGGYDDILFLGGKTYLSASNPTVTGKTNPAPAVVSATLGAGTVSTTPVLMGNAKAKDAISGGNADTAAIDPDSMFVNPAGDLTLDNQAGTALISIHRPGPGQGVTQLTVGTQIDDTVYPTAATGRLLVADTKGGAIYAVTGALDPQTALVAAPDDSGVNGFVGKLDPATGNITPVIIGMVSPHGMAYLPGT